MDQFFPAAAGTDAAMAALSLAVFAAAGIGGMIAAPRDIRARAFLLIAACNVVPYAATIASWRAGPSIWGRGMLAAVLVSVGIGSTALLHFAQVYPRPRPWILARHRLLTIIYPVAGLIPLVLMSMAPSAMIDADIPFLVAVLVLGVPWLFLFLVVLPFAGLLSLVSSYRELTNPGAETERKTTLWILISQLAGGVLAILVIPALRTLAPGSTLVTAASVLLAASGILMPIAFAAAVWKFHLLPSVS